MPTELSKRVHSVTRKLIPLKRLKNAKHNPPRRIDPKNLKKLIDSMDMIGLLHPVTVSVDNTIIEGHRRVASAKILGWKDIECNAVDDDPDTIYASVNVTSRTLSGNDSLCVWLKNPRAVLPSAAAKYQAMQEEIGDALTRQIADAGYSTRVYLTAKRVCRYCEWNYASAVKDVVRWLLKTATIGHVMKAMEAGESPKIILQAVQKNKPIVFKIAIAD